MIFPRVTIEKTVYGGYGLAHFDGRAIFVDKAIPGDTVSVEIFIEKKDYSFARIKEIISPAQIRKESLCPSFHLCGGCSFLCVDYADEINLKKNILLDSLKHIGGIDFEIANVDIITGERFHYRSHALVKRSNGMTGFFSRGTNDIVPFPNEGCMLLAKELFESLSSHTSDRGFRIALSANGSISTSNGNFYKINEHEMNVIYERNVHDFFQSNRFLRASMLERVGEYANLSLDEDFIDIGCGIGFFTLYLASRARFGHGVDINNDCIKSAQDNAKINKIKNVSFELLPASQINPFRKKYDLILADPPRAGLDKKTRQTILAMKSKRIVYVSCNPSTFARDAKDLINGGYSMKKLTFIDMFPCTYHIETIALFELT